MKITSLLIMFLLAAGQCLYSAPVDIPTGIKTNKGIFPKGEDEQVVFKRHYDVANDWLDSISASISAEYEAIEERELDGANSELEAKVYTGKATLSFYDSIDVYVFGGQTDDFEYRARIQGRDVIFNLEDEIIWGGGINAVLYEWEDAGIQLFFDGKYRQIEDADYSSVVVGNTTFQNSQLTTPTVDAEYREWQAALGLSGKIGYFIPYFGVSYSDVKAKARATAGGITYDLDTREAEENIGPFCGLTIVPIDGVSLSGQARFLSEQAFSGNATIRF